MGTSWETALPVLACSQGRQAHTPFTRMTPSLGLGNFVDPRGPQYLCPKGEGPSEQRLLSGLLSDTSNNPLPPCPRAAVSLRLPHHLRDTGALSLPFVLSPSCVCRVSGFLSPGACPPPPGVKAPACPALHSQTRFGGSMCCCPKRGCRDPGSRPRHLQPPSSCCQNC